MYYLLFSTTLITIAVIITIMQPDVQATTALVTINKDPERIMEDCKPRGKDLPPNAKLQIGVIERGDEEECKKEGKFSKFESGGGIEVKYVAYFYKNCSVFDAFYEEEALKFKNAKDAYFVKGFKQGLVGMCPGDVRRIIVPSKLGYGKHGAAYIPGNATLVYEVEMIKYNNPELKKRKKEEQRVKRRRL